MPRLAKPNLPVLNPTHPLARGLAGAWLAHEGGGSAARDSGLYARHGTIGSSVGWSFGPYGRTYNFPVVSHGGVPTTSAVWDIANSYSLVTLFRADTSAGNAVRQLCCNDSGTRVWQWRFTSSNVLNLIRFNSGASIVANFNGTTNVKDGYYHIAIATFSSAVGSAIYLDGHVEATDSGTTANNNAASTPTIGVRGGSSEPFHGDIAMQLIYSRALSDYEARSLTQDPFQAFRRPSPVPLLSSGVSLSDVRLSWNDNSDDEDGFSIERSTVSATEGFSEIDTVAAGVTIYDDEDLAVDTYWYRVRSFRGSTYSDYSNVEEVTVT